MAQRRDRVVVVTGATAGVGRAVARAFARRGDRVALLARGEEGLQAAAEDVRERGGIALPLSVDMADAGAVEAAASTIEQRLGPIDIWVNDAFSSVFAPFLAMTPDEFRRTTEVTYLGFVHGTRAALRLMTARGRGTVVQVGSALAYRGIPLQSAYCGAKHAIQGFSESVRCELMHDRSGVQVTMVQLPAVNTPQFGWVLSRLPRRPRPVAPIFQPEVAARAILYAADHPRRREYWVGWSTVLTLLANKVAPGLLDRYLARTGYSGQQTNQPPRADRQANLWHPVDARGGADAGAHGSFDQQSTRSSPLWWVNTHRAAVVGGIAGVVGAAAAARRATKDRKGAGKQDRKGAGKQVLAGHR